MKLWIHIIIIFGVLVALGRILIWWITRDFCGPFGRGKKLSLKDFNTASQQEKEQVFVDWCERKKINVSGPLTEDQLFDYVTDFKLPTLHDWKQIHGYSPNRTATKSEYNAWLRFIGAKQINISKKDSPSSRFSDFKMNSR